MRLARRGGAVDGQLCIRSAPGEKVQPRGGLAGLLARIGERSVRGHERGLQNATLQLRAHAAGVALHEHVDEFLQALVHRLDRVGATIEQSDLASLSADGVAQAGLELQQAEFSEGDVAIGDRLAQGHASRELEGLRQLGAPHGTVAKTTHVFAACFDGEFRMIKRSSGALACFGRRDLSFIKLDLGIVADGGLNELIDGRSGDRELKRKDDRKEKRMGFHGVAVSSERVPERITGRSRCRQVNRIRAGWVTASEVTSLSSNQQHDSPMARRGAGRTLPFTQAD